MLAFNFDPFPVLTTEHLTLRKLVQDDVNEIMIFRTDEKILKYLNRLPDTSIDEAVSFINQIDANIKNNESIMWGITLSGQTKLIGSICFWNIRKQHHRAETGFVLLPDHHGKGIMTEALTAILQYGFNTMKLHSIEAVVNPLNIASIKLLEKHKFIREAFFREDHFFEGEFYDTAVYSLITH